MGQYWIYALLDPDDWSIRYVGKSVSGMKRINRHLNPSELKAKTYKNRWIISLLKRGEKPIVALLHSSSSKHDLGIWERFYIELYRGLGDSLTNLTDGGEGMSGYKMPIEHKNKIGSGNKGKVRSKIAKKKCSEGQKARWNNPEIRNRILQTRNSEEYKKLQSDSAAKCAIRDSAGAIYESIVDASRKTGASRGNISRQLSGHYKGKLKGLIFERIV